MFFFPPHLFFFWVTALFVTSFHGTCLHQGTLGLDDRREKLEFLSIQQNANASGWLFGLRDPTSLSSKPFFFFSSPPPFIPHFDHVPTAEHFPRGRLCAGDAAADYGHQACAEAAKRRCATSAAVGRIPRLQLPTSGGECQLLVVSIAQKSHVHCCLCS